MNKRIVTALCLSLLAVVLAPALAAQEMSGRGPARAVVLGVGGGIFFDSEETGIIQWAFDLRAGFRLGRHFELSPEGMFGGSPGQSFFYPGVLLNYVGRQMLIGAGIVKPIAMYGYGDTSLAAKFVLGYIRGPLVFTGFFMGSATTERYTSVFEHYRIGLTMGFRF